MITLDMITLEWNWVFFLLPLPWIVRLLLPKAPQSDGGYLRIPFFQRINDIAQEGERFQSKSSLGLRFLLLFIWLLLLFAASGPRYIGSPVSITSQARDLMLAVDVSESMRAQDLRLKGERTDRLSAVKNVLSHFIRRRKTDRMGLILFGSQAYLQTPLTFDNKTLQQLLNDAQIGIAGPKTAIGDAIGLALKRLKDRPDDSKVLIILTDGANTAGEIQPVKAAELAAKKGLKIYTIGIGADEMVVPGILGTQLGSRRVNPSADLDEDTLTKIAEVTGGQYFRAKTTFSLRKIYRMLDKLEPIDASPETYRPSKVLFHFPLGIALILSMFIALFRLLRHYNEQAAIRKQSQTLAENPWEQDKKEQTNA